MLLDDLATKLCLFVKIYFSAYIFISEFWSEKCSFCLVMLSGLLVTKLCVSFVCLFVCLPHNSREIHHTSFNV